jgi:hypothetical protein
MRAFSAKQARREIAAQFYRTTAHTRTTPSRYTVMSVVSVCAMNATKSSQLTISHCGGAPPAFVCRVLCVMSTTPATYTSTFAYSSTSLQLTSYAPMSINQQSAPATPATVAIPPGWLAGKIDKSHMLSIVDFSLFVSFVSLAYAGIMTFFVLRADAGSGRLFACCDVGACDKVIACAVASRGCLTPPHRQDGEDLCGHSAWRAHVSLSRVQSCGHFHDPSRDRCWSRKRLHQRRLDGRHQ